MDGPNEEDDGKKRYGQNRTDREKTFSVRGWQGVYRPFAGTATMKNEAYR
jgi:hypothetical protein